MHLAYKKDQPKTKSSLQPNSSIIKMKCSFLKLLVAFTILAITSASGSGANANASDSDQASSASNQSLRGSSSGEKENVFWKPFWARKKNEGTPYEGRDCTEGGCDLTGCTGKCHCSGGNCKMTTCKNDCSCFAGNCDLGTCRKYCYCQLGNCDLSNCSQTCECSWASNGPCTRSSSGADGDLEFNQPSSDEEEPDSEDFDQDEEDEEEEEEEDVVSATT